METNKINLGKLLEKIFLILIFSILLYAGYSNLVDHKLSHDFPYGYLASDTFQHQVRAQSIKDAGNYKNEAPYMVFGIENVVGYYPPIIYHLSSLLSYASKLEVYDTIQFIVFFTAALSVLIIYLIIKKFSKQVALLALPFSVLIFYNGIYTGFTWGHWPSLVAQFFLISFFWYISNINLKYSFVFLGIFFSATMMTHTSEAVFAFVFFIIFLLYKLFTKEFDINLIKNAIYGGLLTFILSFYFLIIFKYVWAVRQPYSFSVIKQWGAPTIFLSDFGILLVFFAIGLISSLFLFKKKNMLPFLISAAMLIFGYGNYFGFEARAFQIRFFWPIYLSFLFGLGIYQIAKLAYKNWKTAHSIILSVVIIIILITTSFAFIPSYEKLVTPGIMNPYHWEILNWFPKNTDKDKKIYFFYGDIYNQDALLRNAKRYHAQVVPEDFVDAINKKEIRRFYETEIPGDGGGGGAQRKSFFSFYFKADELGSSLGGKKDICNFDYYVFDKISRQPILAQYNLLIASELLKKDFISKVFENEVSIILKNNKPGDDCIEERTF